MTIRLHPILAATAFVLASLAPAAAQQKQSYSADDVVAYFVKNTDMGADRALCIIGTPSCNAPVAVAPAAQAFDMRVQFELNSAELTPDARTLLDAFAEAANRKELRRAKFNIDGHTDGRGSEELNMDLSQRRAQSVVGYLVQKGVEKERLVPRGFGKSKPLTNDTLADENRRVEANIAAID